MKAIYIYPSVFICILFSACDFNINNKPGPQMSMTVNEAKRQGTFICEYTVEGNIINGKSIKTIFAEKRYWRDEGFLLKKTINCCESQLIIVSNDYFSQQATGFGYDWYIPGFETIGSYEIHAGFKGTLFPETMPIEVIVNNKKGKVVSKLLLNKKKSEKT